MSGLATDNSISTGLPEYEQNEELQTEEFIASKTATLPFLFLRALIEHNENKTGFSVYKNIHVKNLERLYSTSIDHVKF